MNEDAPRPSPEPIPATGRIFALDSLRGLAALAVVFHHLLLTAIPLETRIGARSVLALLLSDNDRLDTPDPFTSPGIFALLDATPLHVLWGGNEAVILFFVLSGFVLYLPYANGRPAPYPQFITKRICRIYGPYFAALVLAVALNYTVSTGGIASYGWWMNRTWRLPVRARDVWDHVALVGAFDPMRFNTAFWSLVHEMRLSLVFPAIAMVVRLPGAMRWPLVVVLGLGGAGLSTLLQWPLNNYVESIHYAALFVLGGAIAHQRIELASRLAEVSKLIRWSLIGGAVMIYTYGRYASFPGAGELITGAGAGLLIAVALVWPGFLAARPVRALGTVSYSLYLVHGTVLFTCLYLFHQSLSTPWILTIYVLASFFLAIAFWKLVEDPFIRLGRRLSGRAEARQPVAA